MRAVLIACERASSLEPFTSTRPRCMIPVVNETGIRRNLRALAGAGITDVTVLTGYLADKVREALAPDTDGELQVRTVDVQRPEHAATALAGLLEEERRLVVEAGSFFEDGLLSKLAAGAAETHDEPLVVGLGVNRNPLYHLRAEIDDSGRVTGTRRVELGDIRITQQSPLPAMIARAWVGDRGLVPALERAVGRDGIRLADVVDAALSQGLRPPAVRTGLSTVDMEYPWEILAANYFGLDLLFEDREPRRDIAHSARVHPDAILKGTVILGENVVVESGAVLDNVRIGPDTTIKEHSYVLKSVLGPRCSVGPLGYVKGAVLGTKSRVGTPGEFPVAVAFGNAGYGHHCHAGMAVYGEGSGLMAGAIVTANREDAVKMRIDGKLMDTGWKNLGAFIGDHCRINAGATVMPGRKIGPHSVAGPGLIVYRDIPPRTRVIVRQPLEERKVDTP